MKHTKDSLPTAVQALFKLNNYEVIGPVEIHGAEVDLVARSPASSFTPPIYIEVTVEYVDNTKYGKDLTKFMMIREKEPDAQLLIVSSTGFTVAVLERAGQSRVRTYTYDELFKEFEKFDPYVDLLLGEGATADSLRELARSYERPDFVDQHGKNDALDWLDEWATAGETDSSWLVVVGEYGTGKSALTRMLQRRWVEKYRLDPSHPIPVRIELGAFSRQIDARGLLHWFLDNNGLSHIPIDFFWNLIRQRRIILLLDGYDEMAQYLSQRERRESLKALAELSGEGARGLLTSRPNYFTEVEELNLFEQLYRNIEVRSEFLRERVRARTIAEAEIDDYIQRTLLERYERSLQDLTFEQSSNLVRSVLSSRVEAAEAVIRTLGKVFRAEIDGSERSLSGKPVIVAYLIEVASSLSVELDHPLTEWQLYELVLDNLALRDSAIATGVSVAQRRHFLQKLALWMASQEVRSIGDEDFIDLVEVEFERQLRRSSGANRRSELEQLAQDLRRSSTLTRLQQRGDVLLTFSHNSLREFLLAEYLTENLEGGSPLEKDVAVTDAMRTFVTTLPSERRAKLVNQLAGLWAVRGSTATIGSYLAVIWDSLVAVKRSHGFTEPAVEAMKELSGEPINFDAVRASRMFFSTQGEPSNLAGLSIRGAELSNVSFAQANLRGSAFGGSLLDAVNFEGADLSNSNFQQALLDEVLFTRTDLSEANFVGLDPASTIRVPGVEVGSRVLLSGEAALGWLAFHGAKTDVVSDFLRWRHHPKFPIVEQVSRVLIEGKVRQRRGLERRGPSQNDPSFARDFVDLLIREEILEPVLGRQGLVSLTSVGRGILLNLRDRQVLPTAFVLLLKENGSK